MVTPRWSAPKEPYVPLFPLSSGGMGSVEIAVREHADFARVVAIKRLHPHLLDDESFVSMFIDEARLAAMIRHANVVGVLDVGTDERGPFFVMDYVEGLSLSKVLQHHGQRTELVPLQVCLRIVKQICDGLHAAHELRAADGTELGLVHRDVSPQNVLVGFDGTVRVLDFGVAKAVGRLTKTALGTVKGKYGYMAPEQLLYEPLDRRADLFSLGVLLYELLSGTRLYAGDSHEVAGRILREPAPDPTDSRSDLPDALVELLFQLLAKDRAQRPNDADEVSHRIDVLLGECVAEEGPLDLTDYVRHAFAEQIETQRRNLEAALHDRSSVVRVSAARPTSEPPTRVLPDALVPKHSSARRALLAASVVATALLVSMFAWARTEAPRRAAGAALARAPRVDVTPPPPVPTSSSLAQTPTSAPRGAPRNSGKPAAASGMPIWKWKQ